MTSLAKPKKKPCPSCSESEPSQPRRWASMKETGAYLGVAERTVRYMIDDGRVVAYRLGKTVRIDLNEVDASLVPFGGAVGREAS